MTADSSIIVDRRPTRYIVLAAMGAFLDGYDLLVIGIALLTLKGYFGLNSAQTGALTAAAFAGMAIGSFFFGSIADRLGRKPLFIVDLILFVLASVASGLTHNVVQLIALRFIIGLAIGIDMPTSTAILAEFSDDRNRGKNGVFMQAFWFLGGLAATIVGLVLYLYTGANAWRWALMSGAVPAAAVLIMRQGMPETGYWLKLQKPGPDASGNEVRSGATSNRAGSFRHLLAGHKKPVIFLTTYWFLANLTGSSLLLYTPSIAQDSFGLTGTSTYFFSGGLSVCYTLALLIIAFKIVDASGRKTVALVGWIGVCAMTILLAFSANVEILMVVAFAIGTILLQAAANGPFWPWSVELFPTLLRGTGQGVASAAGKVGGFIGTAVFPTIIALLGWQLSMLTFALLFLIGILVIALLAPETKGKSLADLDTTPLAGSSQPRV